MPSPTEVTTGITESPAMTAGELITACAACETCGEEHPRRLLAPGHPVAGVTWAIPGDGHAYRPQVPLDVIARLREIAGTP